MDIIYSKPNCPGCDQLKAKYKKENIPFKEVVIGRDIDLDIFIGMFPEVKSVPFVWKG